MAARAKEALEADDRKLAEAEVLGVNTITHYWPTRGIFAAPHRKHTAATIVALQDNRAIGSGYIPSRDGAIDLQCRNRRRQ